MTKPKAQVEKKGNFDNFRVLKKEFDSRKMDTRRLNQFREKLISLYKEKKTTSEETKLMEEILTFERAFNKEKKQTISDKNLHFLNQIEEERIKDKAVCKRDDLPPSLFLEKGKEVKFQRSENRDRVFVYVRVTVPVSHQMTREIIDKEERGHTVPEEKYPKERYYVHRHIVKDKDFEDWFDVVEDLITESDDEFEDTQESVVI